MESGKKHLIEDSTRSARPTKRQALSVAHHGESTQSTQYASPAYGSSDSSTNPSEQSDDLESCTPCSTVQGFVDEVCFGMICCVKTQFLDDPSIAAIHPDPDGSGSGYHQLRIAMDRIHMLQTSNGKDIAILNTQASRALSELDRQSLVRYNVYVAAGEWTAKVRSFLTVGKSTCLDIEIHLYGSRSNSACVGRILSDTGLFLQQPDFLDSSILYHNPHEIRFPSIDGSALPMRGPGLEFNSAKDTSVDLVNAILGSLNHTDSLIGRDVDMNVITTELKPHQREALDFIARRETPHTSEPLSLFKRSTGPRNRMYYEHSIIGCRRPEKPPEDFGGIIADEMGLGKTLTMISAIATTMEQAHRFQYGGTNGRNISSAMRRARATLIICPAVLLIDGWLEEVSRHVAPGYLRCTKYHGASKATETEMLESDIVLTTYATLIADSNRNSTLHGIYWFRIIIDEAHSIRQQQTKQFHAVTTLSAKYRWCLTGTPIQNTLNDLGALVRFLRVPQLDKSTEFYSHIAGPIEKRNAHGLQRLRDLLQCICLRRTKELLDVSEPVSHDELVRLSKEEREQYCRIGENHRQDIDQAIARGNLSDASSGLFRAISCLRIFCNSGLCVDSEQIDGRKDKSPSLIEQEDQAICSYCSCDVISVSDCASAGSGVVLSCSHLLCSECIDRSEKVYPNRLCCVTCGKVSSPFRFEQEQSLQWDESSSWLRGYSSKLTALVQNVTQHRTDKCIVFSAWKKSIRLAASYLAAHNISVCVIDGSMTLPERRSTILNFQQDQTVTALLMTLGTGAVGLNLTVANRVHILEPQWNPSIEKQAIGRVIRLGQEKKVTIVRYIVEHTVEQHIRTRQEKKLHLARLGWDSSKTESDDDKFQRVIDMKSLLSVQ